MLGALFLLFTFARQALGVELGPDTEFDAATAEAFAVNLGASIAHDSNIFDTRVNEFESAIGTLRPSMLLATAPSTRRFALLYEGEYAHFFNDSSNDYDDHSLSGVARLKFGSRGRLDLAAATAQGHRGRGNDQTGGLDPTSPLFPAQPDQFDHHKWRARFRYGADGNRGRLRFEAGGDQREHTNNFTRTRPFDYDTVFASAGLSLQFHQRTAVVFDAVLTDIGFDTLAPNGASRDGRDWRFLVGLTWAATAKTVGSVRVGVQERRFDNSAAPDATNPSWEIDVRWSPREDSFVDFQTARINQETFDEGTFIDNIESRIAWTHTWRRDWQSVLRWSLSQMDFINGERNQDLTRLYVGVRKPQGRLLTWEAGYEWRSSDSDLDRSAFEGNMF
ncbi:MAG: outer membrane beta-barrel protein, partial [Gammaproteobacteria bacterium]